MTYQVTIAEGSRVVWNKTFADGKDRSYGDNARRQLVGKLSQLGVARADEIRLWNHPASDSRVVGRDGRIPTGNGVTGAAGPYTATIIRYGPAAA
ncbi:hypothetical protein [Jongsikchunia kroppenstedtii]|uniref:hypothetical protein n=1 Tax=Jongsikchunia kroppenstedtii TaxID=1121721 RepID=UPI0003A97ADF|nr:hypothetical protein [Jongsikchunia kroppenstedtii]